MTRRGLLWRSLAYYWRTALAVWLGVVAGTAVIVGALFVGDSVRGSLRAMTLVRLGRVDHVLTGPRFFREQLAEDLSQLTEFQSRFAAAAPAIIVPGTLERPGDSGAGTAARAGQVEVYAVDRRAWELIGTPEALAPVEAALQGDEVLLSHALARQLGVSAGDTVLLTIELPGDIPRDTLLGKRDEAAVTAPFTVREVLTEASGIGRFGLRPDQQLPRNAFVSLGSLQDRLGLASRRASRRDSRELPARVNTLLVAARVASDQAEAGAADAAEALDRLLPKAWRLDDFHLRLADNERYGYVAVESERMILERPLAEAAIRAAQSLPAASSQSLVYIANEISLAGDSGAEIKPSALSRYSVVAGIGGHLPANHLTTLFGPHDFSGNPPATPLGEGSIAEPDGVGEILVNDWLASDLGAGVGDIVRLKYHTVGSHGELPELDRRFLVRGVIQLTTQGTSQRVPSIAADRGIVPEVPGITDVDSFDDWDAPFPMKKKATQRDEDYWKDYRATPKAFVSLKTAQHLWNSRYGDLTSVRIEVPEGRTLSETHEALHDNLLQELVHAGMFRFAPVRLQGLRSAAGTTDFGGLFVGFSFFLVLSAAILVGLLFRLGVERRANSVGLLQACGFSPRQVRRLLLGEALVVILAGVAVGMAAAYGYAAVMVHGLKTWWIGAIGTRFLDVYARTSSAALGGAIAALIGLAAVWWGIRSLNRISTRALLAGVTQVTSPGGARRAGRRSALAACVVAGLAVVGSVAAAWGLVPAREAFAGFSWPTVVFFAVGAATLAAGLLALAAWIDADALAAVRGAGAFAVARLGTRNAARHRSRSLLSAALVATATFLIVAIAAGRRNPAVEQPDRNSGNGGFTLVAESSVPVLYDLNTAEGREKLGLIDAESVAALRRAGQIVGLAVNPGENASCLNIYQTSQPTILGVPSALVERGGFKFVGAGEDNPWVKLAATEPDGTIPVFGDMNTLQYSLHKGLGQTLELHDERGQPFAARIAGMLDGSVFQGVLLMGEEHFRRLFPSRAGSRYFLIEAPPAEADTVARALESRLSGFDAERVADRLANFLAVQNTYLATFQALGGLGLLLGTIGVATVMLRNVLERRTELALLRAVGFADRRVAWLVLCETALLLGWGLAVGTLSALVAMLPHLLSTGADFSWQGLALALAGVFVTGMCASLAAVAGAVRTPIVATLRGG